MIREERAAILFDPGTPDLAIEQGAAVGTKITLKAADGHSFEAYVAEPQGKPRGAIVVIQEIFGVNSHIRDVADGFAGDGYLAVAPALYDRVQRGYESGYTQAEIQAGIAIRAKITQDQALADVQAAIDYARRAGKVGVVGYCWGGTLAWLAATRGTGLAAAVSYYGGGVADYRDEKPKAPVMFHFGETDHSIPLDKAKAMEAAQPGSPTYFYPAGHGFNCDQRASYHDASAKQARSRTLDFFHKHVG
jgi:carboxymethylenebutenolidase